MLGFLLGWTARGAAEDVADEVADAVGKGTRAIDKAGRAAAGKIAEVTGLSCPKTLGPHYYPEWDESVSPPTKTCRDCGYVVEMTEGSATWNRYVASHSADPEEYAERDEPSLFTRLFG
jgi:hypothetical protein